MAISQIGTSSISGLGYGFKNRIINGAMMIDQRNAGASQTSIGNNTFITDRFSYQRSGLGATAVFNCQQSSTAPTGYGNSAYLTATTGQTLTTTGGVYFVVRHVIEGFNIADALRNQSNVTLSFWVYASNNGTYSLVFRNSGADRSYATTYTVTAANTWQQITVTIPLNASGGTWNYTNGTGLEVFWTLDASDDVCTASNNAWVSSGSYGANGQSHGKMTTGATFYITGVQLEKGSTATSFDYRPYGTELQLCQRYYEKSFSTGTAPADNISSDPVQRDGFGAWVAFTTGAPGGIRSNIQKFAVTKRATPTFTTYYPNVIATSGQFAYFNGSWAATTNLAVTANDSLFAWAANGNVTANNAYLFAGGWAASAEL